MKPKVRARDNSRRKEPGLRSISIFWRPISGAVEIDLDVEMEAVMRRELALGAGILHGRRVFKTLR